MTYNILKNIFKETKINQKDLAKLLGVDQKTICNFTTRNLNDLTFKTIEILSIILDLNIFSLIKIYKTNIKLEEILIPKIIRKYNLDEDLIYNLREKIRFANKKKGKK